MNENEVVNIKGEDAVETVVKDIPLDISQSENDEPKIGYKEYKALKRAKYSENHTKWNKSFLLRHKYTGAVIEIRAVSSCHACNLIGWKPQQVQLLGETTVDIQNEQKV